MVLVRLRVVMYVVCVCNVRCVRCMVCVCVGVCVRCCLTVLPGLLDEGVHSALAVVALGRHGGDVVPAHGLDDVHHGLGLVRVWRDHAGEKVVASVVTQLWSCGSIAHLRDLGRGEREGEERERGRGGGGRRKVSLDTIIQQH